MSAGGLKVAIYSSDPALGDPEEFVFYLAPPYTPEAVEAKRKDMEKRWVEALDKRGKDIRSAIRMSGPYGFFHDDRVDLSERHRGDDEFLLQAWFRMRSPLIVGADVIDYWHGLRREAGFPTYDPVKGDLRPRGVLRNRNDIFDRKAGAS